jgi:hypothetical protein
MKRVIFALLLLPTLTHAKCDEQKGITRLQCHVVMTSGDMLLAEIKGDASTMMLAGAGGSRELQADIAGAMARAKGKPDVQRAIKEYYLAATTYFENPTGLAGKKYKADLDAKTKALDLEMKLAGIP